MSQKHWKKEHIYFRFLFFPFPFVVLLLGEKRKTKSSLLIKCEYHKMLKFRWEPGGDKITLVSFRKNRANNLRNSFRNLNAGDHKLHVNVLFIYNNLLRYKLNKRLIGCQKYSSLKMKSINIISRQVHYLQQQQMDHKPLPQGMPMSFLNQLLFLRYLMMQILMKGWATSDHWYQCSSDLRYNVACKLNVEGNLSTNQKLIPNIYIKMNTGI